MPASPSSWSFAYSSASCIAPAISSATFSGPPLVGVCRRACPRTSNLSSTTTVWILVPPRSMPPRTVFFLAGLTPETYSPGSPCSKRLERPVGSRDSKLLHRVLAGCDACDSDAGAVAGLDVARGVADGEDRLVRQRLAGQPARPLDRRLGEVDALDRIGAVAAEAEVVVEAASGELGVRGGLDVAGGEAEEDALVREALEQLRHAGLDDEVGRVLELQQDQRNQ